MKSLYRASDTKVRPLDELVFQVALLPEMMTGNLAKVTSFTSVYSLPSKVMVAV